MERSVLCVWPAILVALAACSGTTSTSNVTADQACTDLAGSICDVTASCAPFGFQVVYGDASTCKTRLKLTCPSVVSANGSGATPGNIEACAQAYSALHCADLLAGTTPSACRIHGSLAQGAACASNVQCSGATSYCNGGTGQACGACGTQAAAGATCNKNADCQSGLVCGIGSGTIAGSCVTPGAAGATCDAPHPCATPLYCVNATCVPPAAAGAPCDSAAQNCDGTQGLYCDPSTRICKMIKTATAGGACGYSVADGTDTACVGGSCKMPSGSLTGTCQAAAADGAACDATGATAPNCQQPAACTNGVCKIPDASNCH